MSDARSHAESICASLPEPTRARAVELAENVLWMEGKLANAREAIGKSSVAIPYDNGGGQRGIRKNPAFDGYNSLMTSYIKALAQLDSMLSAGGAPTKQANDALSRLRMNVQTMKVRVG